MQESLILRIAGKLLQKTSVKLEKISRYNQKKGRKMKKRFAVKINLLLVLALVMGMCNVSFAAEKVGDLALNETIQKTGDYILKTLPNPQVDAIGGEWAVIGLVRSDSTVPKAFYEAYYGNAVALLKEKQGKLTTNKYSEYSRMILAMTALGKDVRAIGGYNLLEQLADFENIIKQGINGPIFALLALDSKNYEIPVPDSSVKIKTQNTRQMMVDYILSKEITTSEGAIGGFALSGKTPDPDVTGMALQALAKYQDQAKVKAAIERALKALDKMQTADGSFGSWGAENVESIVQVIVGKSAVGVDAAKNVEALMKYQDPKGGFKHVLTESANEMGTEQALYALVAYERYLKGEKALYDMTDIGTVPEKQDAIEVTLNGKSLSFAQPPVNINGRVLVPMRGIFEAMGAEVTWNQKEQKVTGKLAAKEVTLVIGSTQAYINGKTNTLDVPAQLIGDTTMVPVRFISESLDAKVDWDQKANKVVIVK